MRTYLNLILGLTLVSSSAFAADANSVDAVKKQILEIARAHQSSQLDAYQVRQQLDPLVDQLLKLAPVGLEADKKSLVAGGWRSVWADQFFPPNVDLAQIYQVVSPEGYYYNVSKQNFFFDQSATGLLRGIYSDAGKALNIEFTRNALAPGWFAAGTNLTQLAKDVESGAIASYDVLGPVGVTGTLANSYVDGDLRVIKGAQFPLPDTLYIMTRADVIAP